MKNVYRLRFAKYGNMKYLGHLDLMRYFQRALRKAEIPVAFTEGFSPHQILSFAMPLSVGLTSEGEYLDIELCGEPEPERHEDISRDIIERLGNALGDGVSIVSGRFLSEGEGNAMSSVNAASYIVYRKKPFGGPAFSEVLERLNELPSLEYVKKTKKGERVIDLKAHCIFAKTMIFDENFFSEHPFFDRDSGFMTKYNDDAIELLLSAGAPENIRPEILVETVMKTFDPDISIVSEGNGTGPLAIHRLDLFTGSKEGGFRSLGERP